MRQPAFYSSPRPPHVDEPVDHVTLLLDADLRIKAVSAGVAHLFLLTMSDLLGRAVGDFLPHLSLLTGSHDRRFPQGEQARMKLSREHTIMQRSDGSEIPVTVSLFETREGNGVLLWLRHLHTEGEAYCPVPDYCPVPALLRAEERP